MNMLSAAAPAAAPAVDKPRKLTDSCPAKGILKDVRAGWSLKKLQGLMQSRVISAHQFAIAVAVNGVLAKLGGGLNVELTETASGGASIRITIDPVT